MTMEKDVKFSLGSTVMTAGVSEFLRENSVPMTEVIALLHRHSTGDWGDIAAEDRWVNEEALAHGYRILSAYTLRGRVVWVITEADRSRTTVLFPEEY